MKLRMALCLFGQPRTMEFCAPSLKKLLLNVYHPDVFICSTEQMNVMKKLYNPVNIKIYSEDEIYNEIRKRKYRQPDVVPIPGWPQMCINPGRELNYMWQGMKCKEMIADYESKYGIYDVIITTRPDIKFLYIQPITKPIEDCFYVPKIDAHQWEADENGIHWHLGYSAHMWWSSSKVAQILLDGWNYCDEHTKETGIWNGEVRVKWICDKNNIKEVLTDVTHMIIKGDKDHPRSCSLAYGKELSATHYPEYLSPPLPKSGHIPVPQYVWGGEPKPVKQYFDHPKKESRIHRLRREGHNKYRST
jgi:hypothetical protein